MPRTPDAQGVGAAERRSGGAAERRSELFAPVVPVVPVECRKPSSPVTDGVG